MSFDDSRLESADLTAGAEQLLRRLASTGARIRRDAGGIDPDQGVLDQLGTPRGVVVVGPEARLVRAVLEPVCPVPLVAWSLPTLPAWVGPLDLVVGIDLGESSGGAPASVAEPSHAVPALAEGARRGAGIILAGVPGSAAWRAAAARGAVRVPVHGDDALAAAVVVLALLGRVGIAPQVQPEQVARAADLVAEDASPYHGLASNRAKDLACALADADPLFWGGSVLAARASRRVAEAFRRATGGLALSADASELLPVMTSVRPRDPFADPELDGPQHRPVLVVMDDGVVDGRRRGLEEAAVRHDVTVRTIGLPMGVDDGSDALTRYVTLLLQGRYTAAYLALGLGRLDAAADADGQELR
ncbi:phosphoheptose isomerase family protein [Acidipropionibacterium timonense]|uniref:SIS domain-containing protein n=1 Tax=Acidipropionibacterium timonense TaxID=2161818 RepID=UPI001030F38E|nr:SIS domain-containing protein [Acidipropionibacterium timonense]